MLTKINFEIEVEGTFQNGNTINKEAFYALLADVAEQEYDRQFEANKITRKFNFTMKNEEAPLELNTVAQEVTPQETEDSRRRRPLTANTLPGTNLANQK